MFQSTHPHGVRRYSRRPSCPPSCFNPRTHTGCDLWGLVYCGLTYSFNPRTHTGCDSYKTFLNERKALFQSTHPHGVRHPCSSVALPTRSFNPRTHTGCDSTPLYLSLASFMFQSTHPHGVRLYKFRDGLPVI